MPLELVLLYIWKQTRHTIYTEHIICSLTNKTHYYQQKANTHQVIYYFNRTHQDFFKILINWTWSNVKLIFLPHHLETQQYLHIKLSYHIQERKYVPIWCTTMDLQYIIFSTQFTTVWKITNFQHKPRKNLYYFYQCKVSHHLQRGSWQNAMLSCTMWKFQS